MKVKINLSKIDYMIIKSLDGKLHQIYNLGNGNYKVKVEKEK